MMMASFTAMKPKTFLLTSRIQLSCVIASLWTATLSGCALSSQQRQAISQFASASSEIGQFTAAQLPALRQVSIDLNKHSIALGGSASISDLDEAFDPEDIFARVAAAEALSSYGEMLQALVEDTQGQALQEASRTFVSRFKHLPGTRLSDEQLEGVARLVEGIGNFWVERKKAQVLKVVVHQARPDIEIICDRLISDFTRTGLGLSQGMDVTIARVKADADTALAETDLSSAERLVAVEAWARAEAADMRLDTACARAVEALQTLKKANAQLEASLEEPASSIDQIKILGEQIKDLSDAVKLLAG